MARPKSVSDSRVLEVALDCFLAHGPGVSTNVIARQLGLSSQALLKRFGSKRDLLLAAIRPATLASSVPLLLTGPDDRVFSLQLMQLLNDVSEFFVEMARRMAVLRWSEVDCRELMKQYDEPPPLQDIALLTAWFERAAKKRLIRRADFRAISLMLLSALHGPMMLTDLLGHHPTGHSNRDYVTILVQTILNGIGTDLVRNRSV